MPTPSEIALIAEARRIAVNLKASMDSTDSRLLVNQAITTSLALADALEAATAVKEPAGDVSTLIAEARENIDFNKPEFTAHELTLRALLKEVADALESVAKERDDGLRQYTEMGKAFSALRVAVRNALSAGAGIASNPGWSDEDVLRGLADWVWQSQKLRAEYESVAKERDALLEDLMGEAHEAWGDATESERSLSNGLIKAAADRDALLKFLHSLKEVLGYREMSEPWSGHSYISPKESAAVNLINQELRKYEK